MKAAWILLFSYLIFFLAACRGSDQSSPQSQSDKTPSAPSQPTEVSRVETQKSEDPIERLQQEAYSTALDNLELASEQSPDAESVIQSLIEHPNIAYEMFDGCSNYWRDIEPPGDLSEKEWNRSILLDHYESFPSLSQHTRIYPITSEKYLVIITCWFGPYWKATANYIYQETGNTPQITSLILPTYDQKTEQVVLSQSNINYGVQNYDQEKHELTLVYKYRGIGDCGLRATYLLENDELTLTECKGPWRSTSKPPIVILPQNLACLGNQNLVYLGKKFEESKMGEVIPIEPHGRLE